MPIRQSAAPGTDLGCSVFLPLSRLARKGHSSTDAALLLPLENPDFGWMHPVWRADDVDTSNTLAPRLFPTGNRQNGSNKRKHFQAFQLQLNAL
jgi:hypothetical protein